MTQEGFKRKLTAVLSADAVGYSRLMAEDEAATVKTIATYREIMSSLIKQHRGRVVDSPGDNMLAEFSSVVDAVQCAVAVQNEFQTRNIELAENRRMEFRIGINLGDVIDEEDRIYGDGVNIAARLESMADPGGICVSKTAFDQIETKLPLGYEYLGEQSVKNIPKPVGAYRVLMKPDAAGKVIGENRFIGKISRRVAITAICILIVVAGGLTGWNFYLHKSKKVESASLDKMAYPLPDKPSIAVLPFDNMSADPEQEYFCDGITDHIITSLSKIPELFVIARNSTFAYKGKAVKIQQVSEDLGVRYVLEGSVQKSGNRVRIEAQLIDALEGNHLWAESYDRKIEDLFVLQDDIALKILSALQVRLTTISKEWGIGTDNLEAYLKLLEGLYHVFRWNKDDMAFGRKLYKEAIALDPEYAEAYTNLGWTHFHDVTYGWSESPKQSLMQAEELAQKSIGLDNSLPGGHSLVACIYVLKRQYDKAITKGEQAVALNPNNASTNAILGWILTNAGRPKEAISSFKKALRLNPYPPGWYIALLGQAYMLDGQYEEAVAILQKGVQRDPDAFLGYVYLSTAFSLLGREKEARKTAEEVLRLNPTFSLEWYAKTMPYKDQADKKKTDL
jgi:adenylate cyclase